MDSSVPEQLTPSSMVLLIIGEPFSEEEKVHILDEISKGFRSWNVEDTGININEELAEIAHRSSLVEDANSSGKPGERVIEKQTKNLTLEILVNPFAQTVKHFIKKLLTSPAPTKYIIYSGHVFQGSGAWVLQDDTFTFSSFSQIFKNIDVENALKQNTAAKLTIYTLAENIWETNINRADFSSSVKVQVNPSQQLDGFQGVLQFVAYIESLVKVVPITSLLQASEQFGNISFTRPTLYIFPGCQGDSALFGVNGFNLLVNGGYNRRACFWDFARHLDRVDALLMTHLGADNIFSLKTILQRKSLDNVHPQIGYLYFNVLEKISALQTEDSGVDSSKVVSLLINISEEANKITQMAKQLGINPHPCSHNATSASCEPINLYHKLGHGSLDMYVLNPLSDSKELKEFYQLLGKESCNLGTSGAFPLQNVLSVCSLLVWKPYNLDERIVRILFPGNAPQHRVVEGFEKVKTCGFLKYATCTARDLTKPQCIKKPASAGSGKLGAGGKTTNMKPLSSKSEIRKNFNTTKLESPHKEDKTVSDKFEAKSLSPSKPLKSIKDESSKKNLKLSEKPKLNEKEMHLKSREKEAKAIKDSRSFALPSPVKGSVTLSKASLPSKSVTTTKSSSSHESSAVKSAAKFKITSSAEELATEDVDASAGQVEGDALTFDHLDQVNIQPTPETGNYSQQDHLDSDQISGISEARDAVGAIETVKIIDDMSGTVLSTVDKVKLQDLGIYEEEQGINDYETRDKYELEQQEKPQALPEPSVIVESPSQGSEGVPDCNNRTVLHSQGVFELGHADEKQTLDDEVENIDGPDDEQQDDLYPSSVKMSSEFETPTFTNDGPDLRAPSHAPVEQNIQYGINSSNGRDMGGIQEVDEEEHDDDGIFAQGSDVQKEGSLDRESLRDMGIYDDDDNEEDEIKQDLEEGEELGSDRASAERQFEDVDEAADQENQSKQGTDANNPSLPTAFDQDSEPDFEDRDSIDGGTPDDYQNIDETVVSKLNVSVNQFQEGLLDQTREEMEQNAGHELVEDASMNPFIGVEDTDVGQSVENPDYFGEDNDKSASSFDAATQWGQPMGLPSPPLRTSPSGSEKSAGIAKTDGKKRGKTAPTISRPGARPGCAMATKRLSIGSSRSSPLNAKTPTLPPMTPFYVDLTYVPCHGDPLYADAEFFKRIRARYYVISALSPNPQVLDYLLEAKATWEQKDLEVTIIPTYDNETLRHWMALNAERLQELRVDLKPAVSRCTIQLQDLETSLPAYRLEV